jgi:hypothetical protein
MMEGSYGYNLNEKTNVGTMTSGDRRIEVKPENFERAYVIHELMNGRGSMETVLACKTLLLDLKPKKS